MEKELGMEEQKKERQIANTCITVGAGVGALGIASATLTGAICPLCVVVAPGLIGYGTYKKWLGQKENDRSVIDEESQL